VPRLLLLATVLCVLPRGSLAEELPEVSLRYRIQVRIDPETRRLAGRETLRWTNRSEGAVARVPLHLYLNAFAHLGTTFIQEGIESFGGWLDLDRFLRQHPDPWGWIAPKRIEQIVDGRRHRAGFRPIQPDDGNPQDLTLVEVRLPRPVPPGGTLELAIRFEARLPVPIARTGCTPDFCLVAQWFPKIGVLELPGVRGAKQPRWAARQFHAATEFYADFADYEVTVEAPAGWTVGATGRQTASGKASGGYRSVRYAQRAVHDFAIALGSDLHDERRAHRPLGKGQPVQVRYLLPRGLAHQVGRARRAAETTIDLFARRVGPYPYETLTVVLPPYRAMRTSGMEYPTLITGTPADPAWDRFPFADFGAAEFTIVHELGHQYFYGLLASNEQEEAFLDEGINSHWDGQGMRAVFGRTASAGWVLGRAVDALEFYRHGLGLARHRIREPLSKRPSALFYPGTQRFHNYHRGALTMWTAVNRFGQPVIDKVFSAYYRRFRFRHPGLEDFLGVVAETGGAEVTAFLREALVKESVPDFRVASPTRAGATAVACGRRSPIPAGCIATGNPTARCAGCPSPGAAATPQMARRSTRAGC
jgi:hypothetical protein